MDFKLKEIISVTLTLFAVIGVLGSIPVLIDLRQKAGKIESGKASLIALVIMVVFLFVGEQILNVIGIDVASFAIAGSFLIFFVALEMVIGISIFKDATFETVSIVPIAFPFIAGGGTMSTILTLKSSFAEVNIIIGIVVNIVIIYIVLKSINRIERFFGTSGIAIVRKVFGLVLLAMAIKIFRSNTGL